MNITYEQWIAAISAAEAPSDEALLVIEWAKRLSMTQRKANEWIQRGLESGYLQRAPRAATRINGQPVTYTGFRLVERKGAKK